MTLGRVLVALAAFQTATLGCMSTRKDGAGASSGLTQAPDRVFIENSLGSSQRPDWLRSTSVATEAEGFLTFHGMYLAAGHDRLATCYRLAEADIQVRIAQEINQRVKSELLQMAEGMSDRIEPAVLDSLLIEARADLAGLRLSDRYYERFMIGGVERLECHARARMSPVDFNRAKQGLTVSLAQKRPEIQSILDKRQKKFAEVEDVQQ